MVEPNIEPLTELTVLVQWHRTPEDHVKVYQVTGTRHAYYLLRKLVGNSNFRGAVVNDILTDTQGHRIPNPITFNRQDVFCDKTGRFNALLNRNNTNYDLRGNR